MDLDRPHLKPITNTNTPTPTSTTTSTSDLFICFTSLLTTHSHSTSLTTSLSRRLRRNGSITKRVQTQSPAMFQTNHHEPSSPKVTCIGQVRGKSRKHGEKMKMLACRSHPPRNQKWVHLPFTICDTLKEFSCFIPCKSSCFSSSNGEVNGGADSKGGSSSCGGVFRWMVSLHDGEGGGRRDVELVVNGDEDEIMERSCSRRRSIFDDMEFDDLFSNVGISRNDNDNDNDNDNGNDGGGGRVSICVPPKNALLLMRCRSDPMRMASLSKKLWDPPLVEEVIQDVVVIKEEEDHVEFEKLEEMVEITESSVKLEDVSAEIDEIIEPIAEDLLVCSEKLKEKLEGEEEDDENRGKTEENREELEEKQEVVEEEGNLQIVDETQSVEGLNLVDGCSIETITVEETIEECEIDQDLVKKEEEEKEIEVKEKGETEESCVLSTDSSTFKTSLDDSTAESTESESKVGEKEQEKVIFQEGEARKSTEKEKNKPMLPDCLLLMMCEPKLSMEVSKETWVCGTDFIRWLPERPHGKKGNKVEGGEDQSSNSNKKTKASAVAALPPLPPSAQGGRSGIQPGRSSISFPASGGSVANLIEQKLSKAGVGLEPFVLTRCKSAPMRSTAKFEPHRPATCGVGAAGVGF